MKSNIRGFKVFLFWIVFLVITVVMIILSMLSGITSLVRISYIMIIVFMVITIIIDIIASIDNIFDRNGRYWQSWYPVILGLTFLGYGLLKTSLSVIGLVLVASGFFGAYLLGRVVNLNVIGRILPFFGILVSIALSEFGSESLNGGKDLYFRLFMPLINASLAGYMFSRLEWFWRRHIS